VSARSALQQRAGGATHVAVAQVGEELTAGDVLQDHVQVVRVLERAHQLHEERIGDALENVFLVEGVLHLPAVADGTGRKRLRPRAAPVNFGTRDTLWAPALGAHLF